MFPTSFLLVFLEFFSFFSFYPPPPPPLSLSFSLYSLLFFTFSFLSSSRGNICKIYSKNNYIRSVPTKKERKIIIADKAVVQRLIIQSTEANNGGTEANNVEQRQE